MKRVVVRPRIQVPLLVVIFAAWALIGVSYFTAGDVVAERDWFGIALGFMCVIIGGAGIWRALRLGVVIDGTGVRLRHLTSRDQVIPWSSVQSVECAQIDERAGLPVYGPVIQLGGDAGALPIPSLGSYSRQGAERKVKTLLAFSEPDGSTGLSRQVRDVAPPDLAWDDVQHVFDPKVVGSLPDLCVPDTSIEHWQVLLDFVASSRWRYQYTVGESVLPLPRAETVLSRQADTEDALLSVWPSPRWLAIFRFHTPEQIDFDVDLREIQGQEALDEFCTFLTIVGRRLGKPVMMGAEGGDPRSHPLLGYNVETDRVVLADDVSALER